MKNAHKKGMKFGFQTRILALVRIPLILLGIAITFQAKLELQNLGINGIKSELYVQVENTLNRLNAMNDDAYSYDDKDGFKKAKADGTIDLEGRLERYVLKMKNKAIHDLAVNEGVEEEALFNFIAEYDYLGREKSEIIQEAVRKTKMGLMMRSAKVKRILEKMREIIDLYNWD